MMFLLSPLLQSTEPLCTSAVVFEIVWKLSRLKPSNSKYFFHLYLFGFFLTGFIGPFITEREEYLFNKWGRTGAEERNG